MRIGTKILFTNAFYCWQYNTPTDTTKYVHKIQVVRQQFSSQFQDFRKH